MTSRAFAVTWDYRCPFARNAHEHIISALEAGADWDVTFVPFSLNQAHVEEGGVDVWDDPDKQNVLLAPAAAVVVRDNYPDKFLAVHLALFTARHDEGRDLREREVVGDILAEAGVDANAVLAEVDGGGPLDTLRKEHEAAVQGHRVFGVPTFIVDDRAVFVRLMNRPQGDADVARQTIERTVDLLTSWPELNEFKYTSINR
ncbi:MAG TPA: DsbA family protein [Acidimicrobiales bacterium]|nr:DsbA family protein [Acidimicrobiales bacterium]